MHFDFRSMWLDMSVGCMPDQDNCESYAWVTIFPHDSDGILEKISHLTGRNDYMLEVEVAYLNRNLKFSGEFIKMCSY